MSTFGTTLQVALLDGTDGFRISGEAADDRLGSGSDAGDVNGDGFGDLIVGAWVADANGLNSGAAYVLFGKAGASHRTSTCPRSTARPDSGSAGRRRSTMRAGPCRLRAM